MNATPEPCVAVLPGVKLCYRDSGGAGVPLVLLHANTGTSASWEPQFAAFCEARFRVIAFDRRGWGGSIADPASGPQPSSVAEDLSALVEWLGLPAFHLLGVAGGGFVALDYAAWRQDRLRSLVIAASTGSFIEPEMQRLSENLSIPGFKQLPESFREIGPSFRAEHPDRVNAWLAAEQIARQEGTSAQSTRTPNTFAKVASIETSVLAITASADLLAPPSLMRRWTRHLPRVEMREIADAGHSVPMEKPEIFNSIVLDFLQKN